MKKCMTIPCVINAGIFFVCILSLSIAFYVQIHDQMEPCPLCVLQRVWFIAMAIFAGLGIFIKKPLWGCVNEVILLLISIAGVASAGRHVWLQSLPPGQAPACGPGLNFMLKYMPWKEVMHAVFYGSGECAKVDWSFLGVSMPQWSLLAFSVFAVLTMIKLIKRDQPWREITRNPS